METRKTTLTPDLFEPSREVFLQEEEAGALYGPPTSFWKDAWSRFKQNRGALVGLVLIVFVIIAAFVGPLLQPYTVAGQNSNAQFLGPSAEHWFGTDKFGRDLWVRTWSGTQISLYIAFLAAILDLVIGTIYGVVAGYYGGRMDSVLQRIIEILNGIPILIVAILMLLVFSPGIFSIALSLVIVGWVPMARLVRAQVMKLKEQEFFLAARTLGAGDMRLITKHLIPNSLGLIIIQLMFTIPNAIFFEAFLSFIGLGIQIPDASLGALIEDGYQQLRFYSYMLWVPAGILVVLMIGFNVLADGLRDAFDPKMRE